MVLTELLLAGVSVSVGAGYYFLMKQRKLYKLFEGFEKIQEFDFDYLNQLQELPLNKPVAIRAQIESENLKTKPSKYNPKKHVIFSSVQKTLPKNKKITKKILSDEKEYFDEFYDTIENHNLPKFYLRNLKQERIEIQWPKVNEIGLFSIRPIVDNIDPAKIPDVPTESPLEKVTTLIPGSKKTCYSELGIEPDEKYVYVGELKRVPPSKDGQLDVHLVMRPHYILGETKDFFVKYLDGQLMKQRSRVKASFSVAAVLAGIHIAGVVYKRLQPDPRRRKHEKLEKFEKKIAEKI